MHNILKIHMHSSVFLAKHTLSTSSSHCCQRCSLSLSLMNGKYDLMVIVVFASHTQRGCRPIAAFRNTWFNRPSVCLRSKQPSRRTRWQPSIIQLYWRFTWVGERDLVAPIMINNQPKLLFTTRETNIVDTSENSQSFMIPISILRLNNADLT